MRKPFCVARLTPSVGTAVQLLVFALALSLGAPWAVYAAFGVNLIYQFFVHTETVKKLPRPVEFVFNTPSHHRVHHGSDELYLDKNYGGILIDIASHQFDQFLVFTGSTEARITAARSIQGIQLTNSSIPLRRASSRKRGSSGPLPITVKRAPGCAARSRSNAANPRCSPLRYTRRPT